MRRPNPRLQRTRFALLRSPLSRKPLGVLTRVCVALGAATLFSVGACSVNSAAGKPLVVVVRDKFGGAVPGVIVKAVGSGSRAIVGETSSTGEVSFDLEPGDWSLFAEIAGGKALVEPVKVRIPRGHPVQITVDFSTNCWWIVDGHA